MPVVPIIEQDKTLNPIGTSGQLNKIGNPYIARTDALGDALTKVAADMKQTGDESKMIEFQKFQDDWEHTNLNAPDTGAFSRKGKEAFNLPGEFSKKFDDDTRGWMKDNLFNAEQRQMAEKMQVNRRGNIVDRLDSYSRSHMDKYFDDESGAAVSSSVNRAVENHADPSVFGQSINNAKAVVLLKAKRDGLSEADPVVQEQLSKAESSAYTGALAMKADTDPKSAVDFYHQNIGKFKGDDLLKATAVIVPTERKYKATNVATNVLKGSTPLTSQSDIIKFTMSDTIEGGDKIVNDGDGTTKYGINSKANGMTPEEVGALTEDQAAAIYRRDYWDKAKIGDLPQNMQAIGFDTVVNHGVYEGAKLIKDADGDPDKLLQLRAERYQELAKNPKDAPNLKGWMNRLQKISGQVAAQKGDIPDEVEMLKRVDASTNDIEVATDAKALVKQQIAAMKTAKEDGWKAASEDAWGRVNQGQEVPPSVEARMNPKDVSDMRKAEPDPALYEELRDKVARGQPVDLTAYRWRLGGKYNDLMELQKDPNKQADARKVDDVIKEGSSILLGGKNPKSEKDVLKIAAYRRAVENELAIIRKERVPTAEDVDKINMRLLQKVRTQGAENTFGGTTEKRLFEAAPGDKLTKLDGLPNDRVYFTGDKAIPYQTLASNILAYLSSKGLEPNEANVRYYYQGLLKKKLIVERR